MNDTIRTSSPGHGHSGQREVDSAIAADIAIEVEEWFARHRRPLPWRAAGTSPWGILLSEIMAQQTPVARVAGPWLEWMERWPTPAALAGAETADVLRAWGSLGYPRRALRLHECARAIVDRHGGRVPGDLDSLLALPGIGDYTASAILAFAHGTRATVLDTNVRRVIARAVRGEATPTASVSRVERELAATLVPADPAASVRWNEGIMELGALVCTARSPRCEECPLRDRCAWRALGYPASTRPAPRRQAFEGTDRQLRGRVMAALRASSPARIGDLEIACGTEPERFARILAGLETDGLIHRSAPDRYALGPAAEGGPTSRDDSMRP